MLFFFRIFTFQCILLICSMNTLFASCPSNLPQDVWEELTPYFLPNNHPQKKNLDKIFSKMDVLKDDESLKKAGFKQYGAKGYSKTKILKHKKLKNYLIKAFTDDQPQIEWQIWVRRIEGAFVIQSAIDLYGFQDIFKVPKKWIYQVPRKQESFEEKNFILLVEDMKIYDQRGNNILWGSLEHITKHKLDALYIILREVGLIDSVYLNNIPFALDGKITFVDTEHFHKWPVRFNILTSQLSKKMQIYWENLISDEN